LDSINVQAPAARPVWRRGIAMVTLVLIWFAIAILSLWSIAALYIDPRIPSARIPLAIVFAAAIITIVITLRQGIALVLCFFCCCVVLVWWFSLKPTGQADWRPDVAKTAWVAIDDDRVTIHNLRNCDYQTETSYTNCWTDRTVYLSQLNGADFFLVTWGPRWIAHPIVSFQFGDNDHIAFSIEARYKVGQSYSAILGFFRQYELIFVAADERDVIRLRTNYRRAEEVYIYRTNLSPGAALRIFLSYVDYLNQLRDQPEWYNALTRNCTTTLDRQIAAKIPNPQARNYQVILNGSLDRLLYARGRLVTGGLSFEDLREREHINKAANAAEHSADFSAMIRLGRVGF
jgi:Domain of unknown function (DUF4105)